MHNQSPTPKLKRPRRGFTLTELLVVIAIIAMLVAITSVAVMRALGTAKQTRMKTEVDQLDLALKAYKEKYGSYPPRDWSGLGSSNPQLRQHIAQAFPRYNMGLPSDSPPYKILNHDLAKTGIDISVARPDQALVFWLRGFSNDPAHPFVNIDDEILNDGTPTGRKAKRTPFFEFDESRLASVERLPSGQPVEFLDWKAQKKMPSYFPQGVQPGLNGAPYLYWDAAKYGQPTITSAAPPNPYGFNAGTTPKPALYANAGVAVPYFNDTDGDGMVTYDTSVAMPYPALENWVNPDSFQIIGPGTDGKYGPTLAPPAVTYRLFPTGLNYDTSPALADDDNVTNFCSQARLGSAKP